MREVQTRRRLRLVMRQKEPLDVSPTWRYPLPMPMPGQPVCATELEAIELVEGRWGIFGSFDVLVKVVADDEVALTRCIMEEIRKIDGVIDTRTLIGSRI